MTSNVESYLRIHGAIPSEEFSSFDTTTNDVKAETKHTIGSTILEHATNADKVEGDTEQNAKCFGHHKASTATAEQVMERTKALVKQMTDRGLDGVYIAIAPQSIKILVSNFLRMQKKVADMCLRVVEEIDSLTGSRRSQHLPASPS